MLLCALVYFVLHTSSEQQAVPIGDGDMKSVTSAMHNLPAIDRRVHLGLMENLRSLMMRTNLRLQEIGCSTEHLVTCVMDVRHIKCVSNESPLKDVVVATSIGDVFSRLSSRNVITIEHYSTLKRIIITLCSETQALKVELNVYEDRLRRCTLNKALESAKFYDVMSCSNDSEDMVELTLTTDSSWNECPVFPKVLNLEDIIANVFQCEVFALHLRSIDQESQSHKLRFAVSLTILKSVFPLTSEEWVSITAHGVVELKCLEFHYNVLEKGTPHVIFIYLTTFFTHFQYLPQLERKICLLIWKA